MNRATALLIFGVLVALGMILLNYGLIYIQDVYNFFALSARDLTLLRTDHVEATWMFQSTIWTAVFALSIVAVLAYLYYLAKEEFE